MRVLVVEDNPKLASALQSGLREHALAVDIALAGGEGERLAASGVYDLIVLDLMLPDRDGIELCRTMRAQGVQSKILMLTSMNGVEDKVSGLDAGADDYLAKPFQFAEFLARVRALLRRGEASEAGILRFEDLELDLRTRLVKRAGRPIELSNREFALLEYFLRLPGQVLSRAQIGEKVWDMSFELTSNVVDVQVSALRRKIDRGFGRELIQTVKGAGYCLGTVAPKA